MIDRDKLDKRDRLKSALRENLKRRRAQAKGRASLPHGEPRNGRTSDDQRDASPARNARKEPPEA